jgi:hypothetical protein
MAALTRLDDTLYDHSPNSALASCNSFVSKPSMNQLQIFASPDYS